MYALVFTEPDSDTINVCINWKSIDPEASINSRQMNVLAILLISNSGSPHLVLEEAAPPNLSNLTVGIWKTLYTRFQLSKIY